MMTGVTDGSGLARVIYTPPASEPTKALVGAYAECEEQTFGDSVEVATHLVEVLTAQDCMSTVSEREPEPETTFLAQIRSMDDVAYNAPLDLQLKLDPDFVSPADNFGNIRADIWVDESLVASTDDSGASPVYTANTGGTGLIYGTVGLSKDISDGGTRVSLLASTPTEACVRYGAAIELPLNFFKLELDSVAPISGCVENNPCTIPDGGTPPEVAATMSIGGTPVRSVQLDFSSLDEHGPPDDPPAASVLLPASTAYSDGTGSALIEVMTNESESITVSNPLKTLVDVSSPGPAGCTYGYIAASDKRSGFFFEGSVQAVDCALDMQQEWLRVAGKGDDQLCLNVLNTNEAGGCAETMTGVRFELYDEAGVLDTTQTIEKIQGGDIADSPVCQRSVDIFDDSCTGLDLANGERWNFVDVLVEGKKGETILCQVPPDDLTAQGYFSFDKVQFSNSLVSGRKIDVTIYFDCGGACSGANDLEQKFELEIP